MSSKPESIWYCWNARGGFSLGGLYRALLDSQPLSNPADEVSYVCCFHDVCMLSNTADACTYTADTWLAHPSTVQRRATREFKEKEKDSSLPRRMTFNERSGRNSEQLLLLFHKPFMHYFMQEVSQEI